MFHTIGVITVVTLCIIGFLAIIYAIAYIFAERIFPV